MKEREKEKDIVLNSDKPDEIQSAELSPAKDATESSPAQNTKDGQSAALPSFGSQIETISLIGQGGMGTVYKVKDTTLNQYFAIKLLKSELASDKSSLKRFEKEAEAATKLTHENLVAVYRHGITDSGTPYIVMELLDGVNLGQFLKDSGALPLDEAIELFLQIAYALKHVHNVGIVHRDLKPSNVILQSSDSSDLKIKLADFGIASYLKESAEGSETLTKTGDIVGSPAYMSPEQCLGQAPDFTSDLYSLGCMLYATLTTKPPFEGGNPVQIILQQINTAPPPLPDHLLQRDPRYKQLEKVIFKCLAKDKTDRYSSVNQIVEDLEKVKKGEPVSHPWLTSQRKKALTTVVVPILITVTILAFAGQYYVSNMKQAPPVPPTVPSVSAVNPDKNLVDTLQQQAFDHFKEHHYEQALPLLDYVAATHHRTGNYYGEAFCYQCMGQCHLVLGEYEKADEFYSKAIRMMNIFALRRGMPSEMRESMTTEPLYGYIYVLRALNRHDEALSLLRTLKVKNLIKLESFYRDSNDPDDETRVRKLREELEAIQKSEGTAEDNR